MTHGMITRAAMVAGAATLIAGGVAGCSSGSSDSEDLNVYAAASLKATFTDLAHQYEKSNPGHHVKLNFAGSSALVNQIQQGADADVLATADERTMNSLGGKADAPKVFASNILVMATAPGNPKNIEHFADLRNPGIKTVICAVEVPCGAATAKVERNTGVTLAPVSREPSVSAVLTKVTSGEADAGLVYVTDAKGAGNAVSAVGDPAFANVVNKYPIAPLHASAHQSAARGFVDLVLGQQGRDVLGAAGFVTGGS